MSIAPEPTTSLASALDHASKLLRVDPAATEPHLGGVADAYAAHPDACADWHGMLTRIASHRYPPALERIAMARVRDPRRHDVSDAAAALNRPASLSPATSCSGKST